MASGPKEIRLLPLQMEGGLITKKMLQENRKIHYEDEVRKFITHWTRRICADVIQTSKTTDDRRFVWKNPVKMDERVDTQFIGRLVKSIEQQIEGCKIGYSSNEISIDWS